MPRYEIIIGGYGGEVCWSKLTREQFDFWDNKRTLLEKHVIGSSVFDDSDNDNDNDNDNEINLNNIPDYAILRDSDKDWYDLDDLDKEYYCGLSSSWLNVLEVETDPNKQPKYKDVLTFNNIEEDVTSNNLDLIVRNENNDYIKEKYVMQIFSAEKGTFFDGFIDLSDNDLFDINKLKINVSEALNESDERIDSVEYDGVEIDNDGAETRGKGIDVHIFMT